ncbi:MAG: hypothetical protein J6Q35_01870 [Rikenellaceae bacterium]|nr:hypothetical protein [Rikenellaceae bacterium]
MQLSPHHLSLNSHPLHQAVPWPLLYSSSASSISGDEYAQLNRLTITVKVKFTNKFDSKLNYTKTFSQYAEYDSNKLLQEVESTLIPEIVEKLVDDIFNAAVSNW